jgi:ribosome maturation factor RimP
MGTTDSLAALARPALDAVGLELWDVEVSPKLVRFLVDRAGGVDLDAVAAAGTALAPIIEAHDELLPVGPFDLEVSSPGIERTLRTAEHFRRSAGALLTVKTRQPVDASGARRLRATLTGSDEESVELLAEGASEPLRVALADIERARIVFEWGPPGGARPGKGPAKQPKAQRRQTKGSARAGAAGRGHQQNPRSGGAGRPAADEKGSGS